MEFPRIEMSQPFSNFSDINWDTAWSGNSNSSHIYISQAFDKTKFGEDEACMVIFFLVIQENQDIIQIHYNELIHVLLNNIHDMLDNGRSIEEGIVMYTNIHCICGM